MENNKENNIDNQNKDQPIKFVIYKKRRKVLENLAVCECFGKFSTQEEAEKCFENVKEYLDMVNYSFCIGME